MLSSGFGHKGACWDFATLHPSLQGFEGEENLSMDYKKHRVGWDEA